MAAPGVVTRSPPAVRAKMGSWGFSGPVAPLADRKKSGQIRNLPKFVMFLRCLFHVFASFLGVALRNGWMGETYCSDCQADPREDDAAWQEDRPDIRERR